MLLAPVVLVQRELYFAFWFLSVRSLGLGAPFVIVVGVGSTATLSDLSNKDSRCHSPNPAIDRQGIGERPMAGSDEDS